MSVRGGIQFTLSGAFPISATSDAKEWLGGKGTFSCKASNYGTVTLQFLLPDETTWVAAGTDTTLTADGGGNFELPRCQLRVFVASATSVYARASSTM